MNLALHVPHEPPPAIHARMPIPAHGSQQRQASSWEEALEKQETLIRAELSADNDDEWWKKEAIVVEDARDLYARTVAPLDKQIVLLEQARRDVMDGVAELLEKRHPTNPNLARFLREDTPEAYLCW